VFRHGILDFKAGLRFKAIAQLCVKSRIFYDIRISE
jgi:hypothetical protein